VEVLHTGAIAKVIVNEGYAVTAEKKRQISTNSQEMWNSLPKVDVM